MPLPHRVFGCMCTWPGGRSFSVCLCLSLSVYAYIPVPLCLYHYTMLMGTGGGYCCSFLITFERELIIEPDDPDNSRSEKDTDGVKKPSVAESRRQHVRAMEEARRLEERAISVGSHRSSTSPPYIPPVAPDGTATGAGEAYTMRQMLRSLSQKGKGGENMGGGWWYEMMRIWDKEYGVLLLLLCVQILPRGDTEAASAGDDLVTVLDRVVHNINDEVSSDSPFVLPIDSCWGWRWRWWDGLGQIYDRVCRLGPFYLMYEIGTAVFFLFFFSLWVCLCVLVVRRHCHVHGGDGPLLGTEVLTTSDTLIEFISRTIFYLKQQVHRRISYRQKLHFHRKIGMYVFRRVHRRGWEWTPVVTTCCEIWLRDSAYVFLSVVCRLSWRCVMDLWTKFEKIWNP